ncbi:MAG: PSD1 and planctomycete cytochrome C domain-containing protein [Rubripirellula sp.]
MDYLSQIKPLLAEKCYSCHGPLKQESGLRLDTRDAMLDAGVVSIDDSESSDLIQRITSSDPERKMPPPHEGSAFQPDQIELIRTWISEGAVAPEETALSSPLEHWAFQKIQRPAIPASTFDHPIDALLDASRQTLGLRTVGQAERSLLIRRLYLDLIGLPPSDQQLKDQRSWEEIVDELLSSPHCGERWARHWMDIWRYCDWHGLGTQLRFSQKHLWHWRDWIVHSLNDDKGYDRMILEMLAGDEAAPQDMQAISATGFLARNYYLFNRTTWLDNTIEHTGKAFLGLTLNCAKCHDHKYDPITHVDYYRFRAIFEPHQVRLDPIPGVADFEKNGMPRVFDDHIDARTYLHLRGDPKNPDKELEITAGVPAILASFAPEIQPIDLPTNASVPGVRRYVQHDRLHAAIAEVTKAKRELQQTQESLRVAELESKVVKHEPKVFEFVEEFDAIDPKKWKLEGDGWQIIAGELHQSKSTRDAQRASLLASLPRDFDLRCRYTTIGGDTYKSVTFRFDESEDRQFANTVYTSAHAPGPKVQASFTRKGKTTYPSQGRKSHAIEIGKAYQIGIAVRDTLVNVWLDDEFILAYRFPSRGDGGISLAGFDATVAFDSLEIKTLDKNVELRQDGSGNANVSDLQTKLEVAQSNLQTKLAQLRSTEATIAADTAKYNATHSDVQRRVRAKTAAKRQAESQRALAQHTLLSQAGDKSKVKAANAQLAAAEKRLKAIENNDFTYETLRGAKKALETPADKEQDYPTAYSEVSTGRRLALAKWITSRENPLTARVAVNHVWMRHFGTPLVPSVFDFGLRAKKPVQAELLDYLAIEFMESGWSFRHLHRLMVTSQAYQLSSTTTHADPKTAETDRTNGHYWHANTRRMESQVVRDSLLHLAGNLDLSMGGPSLNAKSESNRRSLYFFISPDQQNLFLSMFDDADVMQCYRRSESVVPQQALALANSKLAIDMSQAIAARVATTLGESDDSAFVDAIFFRLLGRSAGEDERAQCMEFLNADSNQVRMRAQLVHVILNHNDFVTIR